MLAHRWSGRYLVAKTLYVETDVALLADVFKNFQKISLTQNGLDPAHYYTSEENLSHQF